MSFAMLIQEDIMTLVPETVLLCHLLFLCFNHFLRGNGQTTSQRGKFFSVIFALSLALAGSFLYYEEGFFWGGTVVSNATTLTLKSALLLCAVGFFVCALFLNDLRRLLSFESMALIELSLVGGLVAFSAHHFILLFAALELQILPLYLLVAMPKNNQASCEGGLKYFILGGLSTSCLLFGISFIYGATSTGYFIEITQWLMERVSMTSDIVSEAPSLFVGLAFLLVTFGFKLSLFPFHNWTPDVYEGAETGTTLFLATAAKIVAVGVMIRLLSDLLLPLHGLFQDVLSGIAILSMFVGALGALQQTSLKRIFAYSTISHMGYLLSAASAGSYSGFNAIVLYLFCYVPIAMCAFVGLLKVASSGKKNVLSLDLLKGLHTSAPGLSAFFAMTMFALAGLPPFPVFFGKVFLFIALVEQNHWFSALSLVLSSLIACYYYLRIIKVIYFETMDEQSALQTS
ncbi:MAG: NADH-quinone oxidoreductase subunit N [Holosporaceae bacterium]